MPPPRRRRPVQPATRVRLPRAARPRTPDTAVPADEAPADGFVKFEAPAREALAEEPLAEKAPAEEAPAEEAPAEEAPAEEAPADGLAAPEVPADLLTGGELPEGEPAEKEAPADDEPAAGEPRRDGRPATGPRLRIPLLPAALGVLTVVLGGLAAWFGLEASSATSGVNTANTALPGQAATSQVARQIASAVDTIFSYNYADTAKTSQAAAAVLTGQARGKYNTLFRLVRLDAPKERLVLTTTVTSSGVEDLNGDRARVLIFANQRATAGATQKTTEAGAMFAVSAVYQGGRWKIAYIETYGAGA